MKKYLIWIGAAVLVMALASPSMAQFKSWGHLEIESYWVQNRSLNKDLNDANMQGVGMRYRFNLGYGDPKTVMAILSFEANSRAFGEGPTDTGVQVIATSFGPGASGGSTGPAVQGNASNVGMAGKTAAGAWGTDAIALQVRHAYFDFTIPNTPLTMQIGLHNFVVGGFLGRFFINKDVPGFVLNANFAPHTLSAFWLKGYKQNFYMDNDLDYYGLLYRLKQQMFNVEAWFLYGNDRRSVQDAWRFTLAPGQTVTQQYPATATTYTWNAVEVVTPRPYEQKPWWLGVNVPITFGNWKFEPTFVYLGGKATDSVTGLGYNAATGTGYNTGDFSAYLGDLMVSYRLGPGLKFLVEGFYATGHDGTKITAKGDTENQFAFPGLANNSASGVAGTENRNVFANGWSVYYFSNTELTYYGFKQLDPSGHMFLRPNVEFNPFPWLNVNFNYIYIMNTANKYAGHIAGAYVPPAGQFNEKTYVGSELNGIAKIAIYKDFQYTVGLGYFWPGDVFDTPAKVADQAWALQTNLRYVF